MIYQTKDAFLWKSGSWNKGFSFSLMEWDVYMKERVEIIKRTKVSALHWLTNNFYLYMQIYMQIDLKI